MLEAPAHLAAELRTAVEASDFPRIVRLARWRAGLTQQQLGAQMNISAATISRLETGRQPLHDIAILRTLATALEITPAWLGLADPGSPPTPPGSRSSAGAARRVATTSAGEDQEDHVKRRQFLVAGTAFLTTASDTITGRIEQLLTIPSTPTPATASLTGLQTQLGRARSAMASAHYTRLSAMLPPLVQTAEAAATAAAGHDRDRIHALLASAYVLTAELATKAGGDGMAWVAADRGLRAARTSGDVLAVTAAARRVAISMRRQGRHAAATGLLADTASRLDADRGDAVPDVVSGYVTLLCTAAYASAQAGNASQAEDYIREAERAATRLPASVTDVSAVTVATVATFRIDIHHALGDPQTALAHAHGVDLNLLGTPEQRARYWIDTARAWHTHGDRERAVDALLSAERTAPEEVRRPSVAALISTLRYAPGPVSSALHALAARATTTSPPRSF
ncbi:helix-turn-helix transcriptional regulator [Nonomuraea longicatena]|uniref:HTH cro/C1-type domain-containing protein n=1 Tax=Nonomuraea longicatena TaxID=83682 RepID=A0ABP3Z919_9ACTN